MWKLWIWICKKWLTEEEVSLLVVEAQHGQRLAAGSELPVGHVVPGVDQFDQSSLSTGRQDAAVLRRGPASPGHQHRGPGQREELLFGERKNADVIDQREEIGDDFL